MSVRSWLPRVNREQEKSQSVTMTAPISPGNVQGDHKSLSSQAFIRMWQPHRASPRASIEDVEVRGPGLQCYAACVSEKMVRTYDTSICKAHEAAYRSSDQPTLYSIYRYFFVKFPYLSIYLSTYLLVSTCPSTYLSIFIFPSIRTYKHTYIRIYLRTCLHACIHTGMYAWIDVDS